MKRLLLIVVLFGCSSVDNENRKHAIETLPAVGFKDSASLLQDISYGSHSSQTFDIYVPKAKDRNGKIIFYVHGGGWYSGDKTEAVHWAKHFQLLGYIFVCLNYRLTNTDENNVHPAQIEDIDAAVVAFLNKAGDWNLNTKDAIIMGPSAGGHLALLYAYRYNKGRKIRIAVSLCGILDLTDEKLLKTDLGDMNGEKMISLFVGDSMTSSHSRRIAASPLFNVSKTSIPTIFIHGKNDQVVPSRQSLRAFQSLKEMGIPAELIILDGVDHDLLDIDLTRQFSKVDSFIKANLHR